MKFNIKIFIAKVFPEKEIIRMKLVHRGKKYAIFSKLIGITLTI